MPPSPSGLALHMNAPTGLKLVEHPLNLWSRLARQNLQKLTDGGALRSTASDVLEDKLHFCFLLYCNNIIRIFQFLM